MRTRGLPNGPNMVFVGGEATLAGLAGLLGAHLGGVPVLDKTGNADGFNFVLEYVVDENTTGRLDRFLQLPAPEPADVPRGQTIFTALEDQLGLKLEAGPGATRVHRHQSRGETIPKLVTSWRLGELAIW